MDCYVLETNFALMGYCELKINYFLTGYYIRATNCSSAGYFGCAVSFFRVGFYATMANYPIMVYYDFSDQLLSNGLLH